MISMSCLSVVAGDRKILQNVSFDMFRRDCILLSGQNGAGKTTLLRVIAGLLRPDSGQCKICECPDITDWRSARRWLFKNIVYLHQDPFIFDTNVRENIRYGLRRRGMSIKKSSLIVDDALEWGELTHLANRNGLCLSGGEKQRVALLRAWVLNPAFLLLDEPIANMDTNGRHSTLFLIRRLISNGAGLIITAHEPRLFLPLADRHLRLDKGQIQSANPVPLPVDAVAQINNHYSFNSRVELQDQQY